MTQSLQRLVLRLDELVAQLQVPKPDVDRLQEELRLVKSGVELAVDRERRLMAASKLFDGLATGGDPAEVAIATVRAMLSVKQNLEARSFANRLLSNPESREAGLVCSAIVAVKAKLPILAGSYLDLATEDVALRHAAPEWYEVSFRRDQDAALLHLATHPDARPTTTLAVVRLCLAHGRVAEAVPLLHSLLDGSGGSGSAAAADALFMERYFDQRAQAATLATAPATKGPRIGIWDFSAPDRNLPEASIVGHLGSLSWLACLGDLQNVRVLTADPAVSEVLASLYTALRRSQHPLPAADGELAPTSVSLVVVPRFAPKDIELPHTTWTIYHGMFGGRVFGTRQQLPFANKMKPIFIGMSVENPAELSTEELETLQRFGPVGCGDKGSVYTLLGLGVDAFYSGPLVSAIGAWLDPVLLKELPLANSAPSFVSVPDLATGISVVRPTSKVLRAADLPSNLAMARSYLSAITGAKSISAIDGETLAAAAALGVPAEYSGAEGGSSDRVLGGARVTLPDSTAGLLRETLRMIADGESEENIYKAWRLSTAELVAASREEFLRPVSVPKPSFDITTVIASLQSKTVSLGKAHGIGHTIHIAMASDERLLGQLAVALKTLLRSTVRPLQVHLLTRGIQPDDYSWLAALFPTVGFEIFPCDDVDYGPSPPRNTYTTVSTLDRLLLPSLLTEVDQIVYLDADLIAITDIAVLSDIVLGEKPIAACTATADWARSGFGHILSAAKRLPTERSTELIRLVARQTNLTFDAFNAGVLVLNLKQMRQDDFCENYLGFPTYFGLNDQEVLFCYAGSRRRELQHAWNSNPSHSFVHKARIIHWAGPVKPWGELGVPFRGVWIKAFNELREHALAAGIPVERLDAAVRHRQTLP